MTSSREGTGPASLTWTSERRSTGVRGPAPGVEAIVRAATALADDHGLDAVSMRRVASALGSGTTSLYRCVDGRDELLDLMVDAALGEDEFPALSGDWREDLTAFARLLRAALLRHPWLGPELTGRPPLGPGGLSRHEFALAATASLTPDATLGSLVVGAVTAYVLGAAASDLAARQAQRRSGLTEDQWRALVGPYVRQVIASGRFPQLARHARDAEGLDADRRFEFGLACVLTGVEREVPRPDGITEPGGDHGA